MMEMMKTFSPFWALQAESCQDVLCELFRNTAASSDLPGAFIFDSKTQSTQTPYQIKNGIAVISISGVIDRVARISFFTGLAFTEGQNRIRAALDMALSDNAVRAILFSVNSPGGAAAGTKELADAIAEAGKIKPVAAYADGLCASAAYWLASATGMIYAPVTAQVGSIGVIAILTDWSKAAEKAGIVRNVISSGQWKAAGSPDKPLTDEERNFFQEQLKAIHSIFKTDVATHMGITAPEEQWAEGQTVLGSEALKLGLISSLVRDQAEAETLFAANLSKEENMDLKQLKTEHPQLVEAIAAEVREQCKLDTQTKIASINSDTLAFVKVVAGDEIASRVESLIKTGLTAAQLEALAPLLKNIPVPANNKEAQAREKMLDEINRASGSPVPASAQIKAYKNPLIADAERRQAQRMVS